MKLELTDSVIRSLKPESKKYSVWDTTGDPTGLGVRIRPSGVKTYVVRARPRPTDRQIMVTLGRAGTMKLASARKAAWEALQQMQRGLNPNHEKRKLNTTLDHIGLDATMTVFYLAIAVFGAAYFLPTIIACTRDVEGKFWIFVLNLLFGFSGLGYALAFVYACGPSKEQLRRAAERERLSEEADWAIVMMERRSREALAYHG